VQTVWQTLNDEITTSEQKDKKQYFVW